MSESVDRQLITGGLVFDGRGSSPTRADVLVEGLRVTAIAPPGTLDVHNARHLDATGRWVMPGFLDTHTHYDGEVLLAPGLTESVRHGVTSVVLGSCSVSFVTADAEDCSDLFTRVEAVPREAVLPALRELKTWSRPSGWRQFIENHPIGPNVATFLGHSDVRASVLGLGRSVSKERPSRDELDQMESLLEEAIDVGFLGLSCMTNPWDKLDGDRHWSAPLPSCFAQGPEMRRLRRLLRRRGFIYQSAPNLVTRLNVLGMVAASAGLARKALKTTLITMMDTKADRYVYRLTSMLAWLANSVLRGDFRWQSPPVPFDVFYDGMDSVLFEEFPTGQAIRHLAKDRAGRDALLRDPAYRRAFRKELNKRLAPKVWHRDLGDATILDAPDSGLVGKSFAQVAEERGTDPVETFLDLMAEHDSALRWHTCLANDRPEVLAKILQHPHTLISFADSGAHLRNMAFYNFGVRFLKRVRDAEKAGAPLMTMERAVQRLTGEQADWFGLDTGSLAEGAVADLIVVDPERLDDSIEEMHLADFAPLPGYQRLVNGGDPVRDVLIGGVPVLQDGVPTEALGTQRTGRFLAARP